jgi:trehalose 6-phosphate synthase
LAGIASRTGPITWASDRCNAAAYPIGIDYKEFSEGGRERGLQRRFRSPQGKRADKRIIIGVDRLDYSKGLEERFLGYRRS